MEDDDEKLELREQGGSDENNEDVNQLLYEMKANLPVRQDDDGALELVPVILRQEEKEKQHVTSLNQFDEADIILPIETTEENDEKIRNEEPEMNEATTLEPNYKNVNKLAALKTKDDSYKMTPEVVSAIKAYNRKIKRQWSHDQRRFRSIRQAPNQKEIQTKLSKVKEFITKFNQEKKNECTETGCISKNNKRRNRVIRQSPNIPDPINEQSDHIPNQLEQMQNELPPSQMPAAPEQSPRQDTPMVIQMPQAPEQNPNAMSNSILKQEPFVGEPQSHEPVVDEMEMEQLERRGGPKSGVGLPPLTDYRSKAGEFKNLNYLS